MLKFKSLMALALLFMMVQGMWATAAMAQDSLRIKLDSLLQDPMFETSQVGLMVYDLTADTVVYQHHARQLMQPASTTQAAIA